MIKVELNPLTVQRHETEIKEWCEENTPEYTHTQLPGMPSIFRPEFYTYWFATEEDATAFKLKWYE